MMYEQVSNECSYNYGKLLLINYLTKKNGKLKRIS